MKPSLAATTGAQWWEAELYRLKGALLLQLPSPDVYGAEVCFQQALAVARSQQAKALELRAALSLSHLWQQQGKCDKARQLLAPIYGWFTEGFETPDLQEAKALLVLGPIGAASIPPMTAREHCHGHDSIGSTKSPNRGHRRGRVG